MPPDMIAGPLPPPAAAPPAIALGAAAAGPPGLDAFPASLFAALLAQSGAPVPKADLKAAAGLDPKSPPALDLKAGTKTDPNLKISQIAKTMDTLPTLAFLLTEKPAAPTSELPLPSRAKREPAPAGDSPAPAVAPADVLAAPALPLPTAWPLPVPLLAAPTLTALVSSAPPRQSAPQQNISAAAPLLTAAPSAAPAAMPSAMLTAAPNAVPAAVPEVLSLPRTFALTAPFAAGSSAPLAAAPTALPVLQSVTSAPQTSPAPQTWPMTLAVPPSLSEVAPTALPTAKNSGPALPLPAPATDQSAVLIQNAALVPSDPLPQAAAPILTPAAASPTPAAPLPAVLASAPITAAVAAALATPAAPPVRAKIAPGKLLGKSPEIALKPGAKNPDTNTSVGAGGALGSAAEAAAPASAPELILTELPLESDAKHEGAALAAADPLLSGPLSALPAPSGDTQAVTLGKPLSAADRAEVVRQAADGVGVMPPPKPGAAQQMSLQLHPKDWGSLHLTISVAPGTEAGAAKTVTAHIVAETPSVKAALQSGTGALHAALRASGLHLERLTVSVKAPSEAAREIVRPAAESTAAGFSSRQGQPDTDGQTPSRQAPNEQTPNGLSFGGGFASGSGQNSRQGSPPSASARYAEPDPEEAALPFTPVRRALGRIDTHA